MKKNIVLVMVVLALMVAPILAESPFSGEFNYTLVYDNDAEEGTDKQFEDFDNSAKIKINAQIDEFTSISSKVSADEGDALEVDEMVLSQDLTAALGIEGPVSVSYKLGLQTWTPEDYSIIKEADAEIGVDVEHKKSKTKYHNFGLEIKEPKDLQGDDSDMFGFVTTLGIMGVANVDLAFYPKGLLNEAEYDEEMAVNVYGTFGLADVSVYYARSALFNFVDGDGDLIDECGDMFGFNALGHFNGFDVSVLFETQLEDTYYKNVVVTDADGFKTVGTEEEATTTDAVSRFAVAGTYTYNNITAELGADVCKIGVDKLKVKDEMVDWNIMDATDVDLKVTYKQDALSTKFKVNTSFDDLAAKSKASVEVKYALEKAELFASAEMKKFKDFEAKEDLAFDLGATVNAGVMEYTFGYTDGADTQDVIDDDHEKGLFFHLTTSF